MIQHWLVYFSVKADHAWQRGDEVTSKHHAKKAKICVIVGIVTGVATYALTLGLYFIWKGDTHEIHNSGIAGWIISPHDTYYSSKIKNNNMVNKNDCHLVALA